jgi:hypothetical protein
MLRGPTSRLSRRPSPGHVAGHIKICVFAGVGRRPCGNFDFLARVFLLGSAEGPVEISIFSLATSTLARSRRGTSQLNCGLPVFNHLPARDANSPAGNARNDVLVERSVVRRGRGRARRGPLLREGILGQGSD